MFYILRMSRKLSACNQMITFTCTEPKNYNQQRIMTDYVVALTRWNQMWWWRWRPAAHCAEQSWDTEIWFFFFPIAYFSIVCTRLSFSRVNRQMLASLRHTQTERTWTRSRFFYSTTVRRWVLSFLLYISTTTTSTLLNIDMCWKLEGNMYHIRDL